MKRTINVEQRHIESGKQCSNRECPIALAANEALKRSDAYVTHDYILSEVLRRRTSEDWGGAFLPEAAQRFIEDWDNGCEVKPFSFELDIP